ncbi:MAG: NifB/NifX family molybdenum-iron cluster-binding protein [Clostridia bacterium]|nr:NifB/NifX family molybdenum-iron cluster-binding protein [Clostridia bacterium]
MRLAVTSQGSQLESPVDPRFGRCAYLVVLDLDTGSWEAIVNPGANASGGAGIQTAQLVVDLGANAVATGNIGPNAMAVLNSAGIQVYNASHGSVRDTAVAFNERRLRPVPESTVGTHFGMGGRGSGGGGAQRGRGRTGFGRS